MELRRLASTGLDVSPIGLGTVKLGRDTGLKYATPPRIPSDDEAIDLLRTAHQLGINLIDTAPAYGNAEERLGNLLYKVAPRKSWVLSTKVGEYFDPSTISSRYDFSPAAIRASIHQSLKNLRTDHLDIALLHFASSSNLDEETLSGRRETTAQPSPIGGEALATLRELHDEGIIGAVGASTGTLAGGLIAAKLCHVVMVTLNALDQSQIAVVEAAHRASCGVLLKKTLAGGRAEPRTLRALLGTPGATSAIIGTTNPANLRAAVAALS